MSEPIRQLGLVPNPVLEPASGITDEMVEQAARGIARAGGWPAAMTDAAERVREVRRQEARRALEAALAGRLVVDMPAAESDAAINRQDLQAREHLYALLKEGIEYSLTTYGGFNAGGSRRGVDAWREAPLPELLASVMTYLRAGMSPAMDREAVESGVRWIKANLEHVSGLLAPEKSAASRPSGQVSS